MQIIAMWLEKSRNTDLVVVCLAHLLFFEFNLWIIKESVIRFGYPQ